MNIELFEYFNTTNQTSPHCEAHLNFAKPVAQQRCERLTLLDKSRRCDYARNSDACQARVFMLNYNSLFYCGCDDNDLFRFMCIVLLLLVSFLLFWVICFTTKNFFVPALMDISKSLNINEYFAGLTVLTLGNNAPDIFGGIVTIHSDSRHVYSDAMSVNLFVSVFTSSIIIWIKPFAIDGTFFLRDVGFVLLYVSYVDFTIKICNGYITVAWAVSMALICPIYVVVVVCDEYLQYRRDKELREKTKQMSELEGSLTNHSLSFPTSSPTSLLDIRRRTNAPNRHILKQFFQVFDTLDRKGFRSQWTICKMWALIKVPPLILLRLYIPQTYFQDCEYTWSKLLCCIQIFLTPTTIIVLFVHIYLKLQKWTLPAVGICCCITIPLSIVAFRHSRTDTVPRWYTYMAILNVIGSIFILYAATKELVAVVETVGITLNRSHTFIGCTLFTWGCTLSDFMSNLGMARKGFPRMAFSACFGYIIFATFGGVCLPVLYNVIATPPDHRGYRWRIGLYYADHRARYDHFVWRYH
ncbi:mitochondrial sodium/calcium exchanger protein-like isoform X2 [Drosophila novamexicana]|uniref:mitochondrial sodium/calcium exchanger protein-like isoform X2 n=1 Tax=Drosophila novamexicana TaxID=47314 RepID=UPI0011E5E0AF|nr:mitochondrial sodium/calcium exchanger protein-like isoform X2 [Drosophila novamexicana]